MRKEIIETKIAEILDNLSIIKENLPNRKDEFTHLGLIKDGIYKKIEFCIQNLYDICSIINTDLKIGIPEGDENIIDNLIEKKVFNKHLGEKLKQMKGFRNILVHRYGKINDSLAYEVLKHNLDDFYEIIERIDSFINDINKE